MASANEQDPKFSRATSDFNRVPSFTSDDGAVDAHDDSKDGAAHLVYYNKETYDITEFLNKHPGGRSILEKYEGKDITRAFDDINHSEFAKSTLSSYIKKNDTKKVEVSFKNHKIDWGFIKKKLFSKEDQNFIHKTFGLLSLMSFIYRYCFVFPHTGGLGFGGATPFDWATLGVHFFLSFSSLIFHVVERRIVSNPLIIYQEYRLHAIVFTLRAVLITIFGWYQHLFPGNMARVALGLMMFAIHSTVDYITSLYGTPGITTVRVDNDGKIAEIKLFFAFYQVLAMSTHVVLDPMLCDLGWNTAIAIQSSAFLMTLKRKSLIRSKTHFFWYALALLLSMLDIYIIKGPMYCLVIGALFYVKVKTNMNKYVMWTLFALGYYYVQDHGSVAAAAEHAVATATALMAGKAEL